MFCLFKEQKGKLLYSKITFRRAGMSRILLLLEACFVFHNFFWNWRLLICDSKFIKQFFQNYVITHHEQKMKTLINTQFSVFGYSKLSSTNEIIYFDVPTQHIQHDWVTSSQKPIINQSRAKYQAFVQFSIGFCWIIMETIRKTLHEWTFVFFNHIHDYNRKMQKI